MTATRQEILKVVKDLKLTTNGFATVDGRHEPFPPEQVDEHFVDWVNDCLQFLDGLPRTRAVDGGGPTTYGLKHVVEAWKLGRGDDFGGYVSNAAFIIAAAIAGLQVPACRPGSANGYVNLSRSSEWPESTRTQIHRGKPNLLF